MRERQEKSKTLLCCYAREDQAMLHDLKKHLTALEKEGLISLWDDTNISPGAPWEQEITHQLHTAQIILLLVSSDFIASEYCYGKEMKQAIGRHDNDTARVIPIILRPVDWQKTPLGLLQALPKDGKPVRQWRDLDEAYVNITEGVRTIAENWLPQSTSGSLSEENIFAYDAFLTKEECFQLQRIQAEYANTLDETADDPDVLYEKGLTYYAQNRSKEAILLWRQGHTQYPNYGNGIFVGNLKEHLQKLRPQQIQELYQQADTAYKEGMLDEQITYLQMLLELQPDEPDAVSKLATAMKNKRYIWKSEKVRQLIHDGNIQLAQSLLADLIEQVPQFPNITMLTELLQKKIAEQKAEKIKLFIDQNRYANAVHLLTEMKNTSPGYSETLVPLLEEYLYKNMCQQIQQSILNGEIDKARQQINALEELVPQHPELAKLEQQLEQFIYDCAHQIIEPLIAANQFPLARKELRAIQQRIPQCPNFAYLEAQINVEEGRCLFAELQRLTQHTSTTSYAIWQKLESLCKQTPPHPQLTDLERQLYTWLNQQTQQALLKGEIKNASRLINQLWQLTPQYPELPKLQLQLQQYLYRKKFLYAENTLNNSDIDTIIKTFDELGRWLYFNKGPSYWTSSGRGFRRQITQSLAHLELEDQFEKRLVLEIQQAIQRGDSSSAKDLLHILRRKIPGAQEIPSLTNKLCTQLYANTTQNFKKQPFQKTEKQLEEIWRLNPAFPDSVKLLEKMELYKSSKIKDILLPLFCLTLGWDATIGLLTQSWPWIIVLAIAASLITYRFKIPIYKKRVLYSSIIITNIISFVMVFFLARYFFQLDYSHPQAIYFWLIERHSIWLQRQVIFGIALSIVFLLSLDFMNATFRSITLTLILILFFIAPLLNWGFGFGSGWYLILLGALFNFIGALGLGMTINARTSTITKKSNKQIFLEKHGLAPTQQTRPPTPRYRQTSRYSNKRV